MELNIGTNIKRLRLSKGLTQEQLAELLCITTAAVSKWEAKNTYPDITMLFPLAQIFDVTIDELLGYDEAKASAEVESYLTEHRKCEINGERARAREIIGEARKKYPHDFRIMSRYMWDKAGGMADNDHAVLLENKEEFLQICNCILDGCKIDSIRAGAMNMKAKLLHAEGDTEGALEILSQLPNFYSQQITEQLFHKDTEEYRFWNRRNCYGMIDVMAIKLARTFLFDNTLSYEEKIRKAETVAEEFSKLSVSEDMESFCIAEQAVYSSLLGYMSVYGKDNEKKSHIAKKQLLTMAKMVNLAKRDPVLKDCMEKTYQINDLTGWIKKLIGEYPEKEAEELLGSLNE